MAKKIDTEFWLTVAKLVLTSRKIDEIEENELVPQGKIAYQFSSKGHELSQVLLSLSLRHQHDGSTVYYRSRPFMLANGFTPREAFAADFSLTGSPSEGRDVGVVYSLPPREGATVLPSSGAVGAQYTPAAGWAQAIHYYQNELNDKSWKNSIAVALGGDGSVATSGFWSALTIATTQSLPMLFFIEDNGVAISVPRSFQTPGKNIAENLSSFTNLHILQGSGTNPSEANELIQSAVGYVRSNQKPCLIRLDVPRLMGHTYGEDQRAYKDKAQLEEEQSRDPIIALKSFLPNIDWKSLESEIDKYVRAELAIALNEPAPDPKSVDMHLFETDQSQLVPPIDSNKLVPNFNILADDGSRINFSESVRKTIASELSANPKLMVFGEDVGIRGGVHRVTVDLQAKFGENRVFDTSLSEEGIIGRATGLALAGLRPLPEIQFRKYTDPATEQINDAGWIRWRTAGKFGAPTVIRIPIGYSKKTGDPWHSVSGEAIFAHSLGWRIAIPSNAVDAAGLLRTALRENDPSFFLEHRALLDTPNGRAPYPGDEYCLPFGKAKVVQDGSDLTIVTWGEMVHRCIQASRKFEGSVEIIDLRTIIPWDKELVLQSLAKTNRCLIAHEDAITGGFGGEIAAALGEEAFTNLDAPIQRIATKDLPIPYNDAMMEEVIPSIGKIALKIEGLLNW
jgi:2-oxoisovalerate dehydrogenase E1 component